jgi:hypothetical protein
MTRKQKVTMLSNDRVTASSILLSRFISRLS